MKKLLVVARYEFSRNARRVSYLLLTFGVPAFTVVAALLLRGAAPSSASAGPSGAIGYVDAAGELGSSSHRSDFIRYADAESAEAALLHGTITHYVVVPADFLDTGRIDLYGREIALGGEGTTEAAVTQFVRQSLAGNRLPPQLETRVVQPPEYQLFRIDQQGRAQTLEAAARRLLAANLFTILLAVAIFSASQFLLQGVTEEKENRVIEVLVSSVSPEQLIEGKILGLGALGLLQVGFWASSARLLSPLVSTGVQDLTSIAVAPNLLALMVLLFLLGYLFFASLMAAIGAMASSMREGQQIAGILTTLTLVPVWFTGSLVNQPHSGLALFLTYFPFTAPTALMQRLPSGQVSTGELLLAIGVLLIFVALMTLAANRIFRAGLLLYGKRPTIGLIMSTLIYG